MRYSGVRQQGGTHRGTPRGVHPTTARVHPPLPGYHRSATVWHCLALFGTSGSLFGTVWHCLALFGTVFVGFCHGRVLPWSGSAMVGDISGVIIHSVLLSVSQTRRTGSLRKVEPATGENVPGRCYPGGVVPGRCGTRGCTYHRRWGPRH